MEQIFSYIFFLCVWFGVVLAYYLEITKPDKDTVLVTLWKYFSYYTGITNVLVAMSISCILFLPSTILSEFFRDSNVSAAITLYIVSVGIGNYAFFGFQKRSFWSQTADLLTHGVTPVLSFVFWLVFSDKTNLSYAMIPYWLIYPLSYALYTAIHGTWTKFYPYPFANVKELGWKKVGLNTLGLTVSVVIGSALLISLGKVIA